MAALLLSLTGAAIKLSGYARYVVGILRGEMRPNMATWTLWIFLSSLNSASYLVMSGDPLKSAVAIAGTTGCLITYAVAMRKGVMQPLNSWDRAALGSGFVAAAAWIAFRSASSANLILQAGFLISMIPTYRGLLADRNAEKPAPWLLMAGAYAVNGAVVALRWDGHPAQFAYPLINIVSHAGVGIFAAMRNVPQLAVQPAEER